MSKLIEALKEYEIPLSGNYAQDIAEYGVPAVEREKRRRQALAAHEAEPVAVPPGCVVVPLEPDIASETMNQFVWDFLDALPDAAHLNGYALNDLKLTIHKALCKWLAAVLQGYSSDR